MLRAAGAIRSTSAKARSISSRCRRSLGVFLKELEPALNIWMVETLEGPSLESSDAPSSALIWLGEEHRRRPGVDLAAMR